MPPIYAPRGSLELQTRGRQQIDNFFDRRAPVAGEVARADAEGRKYPNAIRRTDQLSAIYNCHGLTFAARRTGISAATQVIKILSDDEYTEIAESAVQPGDIVVWYNDDNGDVEHSAIVLE